MNKNFEKLKQIVFKVRKEQELKEVEKERLQLIKLKECETEAKRIFDNMYEICIHQANQGRRELELYRIKSCSEDMELRVYTMKKIEELLKENGIKHKKVSNDYITSLNLIIIE